jgi:hypothetical protein
MWLATTGREDNASLRFYDICNTVGNVERVNRDDAATQSVDSGTPPERDTHVHDASGRR